MPFTIDTSGIDADYPVTGEDNDSQGFRDNWAAIKTAFNDASSEITVLQNRSFTGSVGPQGPIGYAGSASTIIGYTGSASSGGGGAVGYTGSAGDASGAGGYTGSASSQGGYTGSDGYTGSSGNSLLYQATSFTAIANNQYIIDTAGGSVTLTLPATPATGNYVTFTAKNLQTNTVTVTDGDALSDVYDKTIDGAKYYYNGAAWQQIGDGTVRSYTNTSSYYEVAVFDDNASNLLHTTPVTIDYGTGQVTIPAPTSAAVTAGLVVSGFVGYSGSAIDPSKPAIVSNGAAYTTTVTVTQDGTTIDIDCGSSNVFYSNLTGTVSTINLNNPYDGQTINWFIKKESPTAVTWPASWLWQNGIPSAVTAVASTDVLTATYLGATSKWYVTLLTDMKVAP